MKFSLVTLIAFGLAGANALGGFTDPLVSSGEKAKELPVQRMGHQNFVPSDRPYVAPNQPAASTLATDPGKQPQKSAPTKAPQAPVVKAPGLPWERGPVEVPGLRLPAKRNIAPPMEVVRLNPNKRDEVLAFLAKARAMPLPERTYSSGEAASIQGKFKDALNPYPHSPIHRAVSLTLQEIASIQVPPAAIHYENMVTRLDALFDGFYLRPHLAVASLWELSEQNANARSLQARDALFAGIVSQEAGWEMAAGNLFVRSAQKGIEEQDRYLNLLWSKLENFSDPLMAQRVVHQINPKRVAMTAPKGDQANYALALILLNRARDEGRTKFQEAEAFAKRVSSQELRARFSLLAMPALSENFTAKDRVALLRNLTKEAPDGSPVQQEVKLALARDLLRSGSTGESLDEYRSIKKSGKNRLEIMGEQAYVEFRSGYHGESLGKSVGLQSPYFRYGYSPEVHVVEVLNRKALCDFGGAESGVARFKSAYAPEARGLKEFSSSSDPILAYENLISRHQSAEPLKFERFLLNSSSIAERQKLLNRGVSDYVNLEKVGLKSYSTRPTSWDDFLFAMKVQWSAYAFRLKTEIGEIALKESKALLGKLQEALVQTELLSLDIASEAARNFHLQSALNFPVRRLASEQRSGKDIFHWPFEEEVWEDELDFLNMKNPSRCARSMAQ